MTAEIKYGPPVVYGKRTCKGCAAFTTEAWSVGDDGEGNAEDFGLEARCNYRGNSSQITMYYTATNSDVPAWCPAEEAKRAEISPSTKSIINRYWEADDRFPDWCPLESSASAHRGGYVSVIDVEKLLCSKLGREWSPTGISIESLVNDLSSERKGQQ